uniref:Keratin n=1 Tax=Gopherus evgoodei TaxID=1825980 RepID=A0A8C4WK34_9SAUR
LSCMTFSSLCYPECRVARPCPVTDSYNEPCVRQCPDSKVVIRPSPVVMTLPGPILRAPVVGPSSWDTFSFGGLNGSGGHYGGLSALEGYGGYGALCGLVSCHRYLSGNCGPC